MLQRASSSHITHAVQNFLGGVPVSFDARVRFLPKTYDENQVLFFVSVFLYLPMPSYCSLCVYRCCIVLRKDRLLLLIPVFKLGIYFVVAVADGPLHLIFDVAAAKNHFLSIR